MSSGGHQGSGACDREAARIGAEAFADAFFERHNETARPDGGAEPGGDTRPDKTTAEATHPASTPDPFPPSQS